ncbi:MAG: DnaJ domain-containing protein [SAR324 cluster bacterium]|nr:DnaJ domain-containing protein [SAR324 cluster bacterium]
MDINKDYYAVLGLLPSAEEIVITATYRALAKRYHPDHFDGPKELGETKMKDLNEAYAVLSNPSEKKKYDEARIRDSGIDSDFFENQHDKPPSFDPLEENWNTALTYYPHLNHLESELAKISWKLAYSFRIIVLETKSFKKADDLAKSMRKQFLEMYFGKHPKILKLVEELIRRDARDALRELNKAISVLGSDIDADNVVKPILSKYFSSATAANKADDLTACFNIIVIALLIIFFVFLFIYYLPTF